MKKRAPRYRRRPANQAWWVVRHPDGTTEKILDLKRWCKAHGLNYQTLWRNGSLEGYAAMKADNAAQGVDTTQT